MKHLKQYEEKLGHFKGEIKNFILIENEAGFFIYDIDKENYGCKLLFFSKEYKKINKTDLLNAIGYFYKIDRILMFDDELLYQSDNLDDVINQFEIITSSNKFNL